MASLELLVVAIVVAIFAVALCWVVSGRKRNTAMGKSQSSGAENTEDESRKSG